MAPPNALSTVKSEVSILITSFRCSPRSNFRTSQEESKRVLLNSLVALRNTLNETPELESLNPLTYLTPFLDVIRSDSTTGFITGSALSSVEKFLAYGLLEVRPGSQNASENSIGIAIEAIAEATIQTRFIRSRLSSDEVVLMKIVHLLRTLLLIPSGAYLSNEMVYEIIQNGLRICLETKLSELLRRTTEQFLASIVQLFFSRLPALILSAETNNQLNVDETSVPVSHRGSQRPTIHMDNSQSTSTKLSSDTVDINQTEEAKTVGSLEANPPRRDESICSLGDHLVEDTLQDPLATHLSESAQPQSPLSTSPLSFKVEIGEEVGENHTVEESSVSEEHICRPYNLQAVHNLFALLVDLLNPEQQDNVIKVALSLLAVAFETGADFLHACPSILRLVATDLTKYLMMLLFQERISLFASTLRLSFLLFESLRVHLKLQLEVYFHRLIAIISHDNDRITYEQREMALDAVVQLFLLPGLAAEIYVNYDCDPYCSNLFDDITEMLTKNAYPSNNRLMGMNILALDALLSMVDAIDVQTGAAIEEGAQEGVTRLKSSNCRTSMPRPNRHWNPSSNLPTHDNLVLQKTRKKLLMNGSDRFNLMPKDGIAFLQKNGLLADPLDAVEMATFLAENPRLDKKMIGEFLSSRKNTDILVAFVRHFNFKGIRIDESLRTYLEAFRIPGEAPLIQHLMESFAEQWFKANDGPFFNSDAAFTLSYAILMLNTDQHNPNSRRQNIPMTCADFKKNLKGMNGGGEFDPSLIEAIYESIRNREIVMPSEQTGAVRDNYLWKCLARRSCQPGFAHYLHLPPGHFDSDLFVMLWGSTVAALSYVLDKTTDPALQAKTMAGFVRCARIAAHFHLTEVFDNLIISLAKFTLLLSPTESPETVGVALGRSAKAQMATRLVFALAAAHGDMLREGWRSLMLDCLLRLLHANLLPSLVRSPQFLPSNLAGPASSYGVSNENMNETGRSDLGVLGSFYHYLTLGSSSNLEPQSSESPMEDPLDIQQQSVYCLDESPTTSGQVPPRCFTSATDLFRLIDASNASAFILPQTGHDDDVTAFQTAKAVVEECQIGGLFEESKFLMLESLQELIKALLYGLTNGGTGVDAYDSVAPETTMGGERSQVFCLELLLQVLLYNRDRIDQLWMMVCGVLVEILRNAREPTLLVECIVAGMLRLAVRLLNRQQELATQIFACLLTILQERGAYLLRPSPQISPGSNPSATSNKRLNRLKSSEFPSGTYPDGTSSGVSSVARQVVCGIDALLREEGGTVAMEIPSPRDWELILSLLEVCGAGAFPITPEELQGLDLRGRQDAMRITHLHSSLQNVATESVTDSSQLSPRDCVSDNESGIGGSLTSTTMAEMRRQISPSNVVGGVESWVLVNVVDKNQDQSDPEKVNTRESPVPAATEEPKKKNMNRGSSLIPSSRLRLPIVVAFQDLFALEKACDSIVFVVRDATHITPNNIEYCVHTLRVFVEAVLMPSKPSIIRKTSSITNNERFSPLVFETSEYRPPDPFSNQIALQLLDLVYTLFSRAPSIYAEWTKPTEEQVIESPKESPSQVEATVECLWPVCWRALLQAIARLCVDSRRDVRVDALAFLQRALLSPILHILTGEQWLDCFNQVIFPLLTNFIETVTFDEPVNTSAPNQQAMTNSISNYRSVGSQSNLSGGFFLNIFGGGGNNTAASGVDPIPQRSSVSGALAEYTDPRMRAIPLLTKVFLQHLSPLYALDDFLQLWSRMLTYMEKYIRANISDSLNDAVRESLKNLLLVLYTGTQDTAPILVRDAPEGSKQALLWSTTYLQLERFMPNLMDQLFPPPVPEKVPVEVPQVVPQPSSLPSSEFVQIPLEQAPVTSSDVSVPPIPAAPATVFEPALSSAATSSQSSEMPDRTVPEIPQLPVGAVRIQLPIEESDTEGGCS
nr:golgi specific brefeldin a resistance guanine [Hymenolepis microstoma]